MIDLQRVVKKFVSLNEEQSTQFFSMPFLVVELPTPEEINPEEDTKALEVTDVLSMAETKQAIAGKKVAPLGSSQHFSVGRDHDSAIQVPDGTVSRKHASITRLPDGTYIVADLGSSNGTMVNGQAVPPMSTHPLVDRDRITFGAVEASFFQGPTFKKLVEAVVKRLQI